MSEEDNSLRMVQKLFKCPLCLKGFKKLVRVNENFSKCPECGHEHCTESINSEFNRESVSAESQYRIPFCNLPESVRREYHTVTDIHDRNPNNFYLDNERNSRYSPNINNNTNNTYSYSNQNTNSTFNNNMNIPNTNSNTNQNQNNNQNNQNNNMRNSNLFFIPFNVSPFSGSVNRHPFNFAVFEGPIGSNNDFVNPSDNFFLDNFASNFISNFINPMTRIVFINNMQNQHQGNPPAAQTAIDKLKHFKMEKKYCKKSDQDPNKLEFPECSICLMEVNEGQNTILLPCGHMFHEECVTKWLKIHNTCPLCRFELPTDNADYERQRNERNQQREERVRNNPNVRPVDFNHPEHLRSNVNNSQNQNNNSQNQNNNSQNQNNNSQSQNNNSENNNSGNQNININLQGEDMSDI